MTISGSSGTISGLLQTFGEIDLSSTCGHTVSGAQYGIPQLLSVNDTNDLVEVTYIEIATTYVTYGYNDVPPRRVFKIIYSCVDGKFHKSERIYGKIIPATDEMYEFE